MKIDEIITAVKELNLAKGSFVVFGSCPMAAAGIREAGDIDLLATPKVREKFAQLGWEEINKGPLDKPVTNGVVEIHDNWEFSSYKPTLAQLLSTADYVEDIPFASLGEVRKWKAASGRPKDIVDIKLIDDYLARTHS